VLCRVATRRDRVVRDDVSLTTRRRPVSDGSDHVNQHHAERGSGRRAASIVEAAVSVQPRDQGRLVRARFGTVVPDDVHAGEVDKQTFFIIREDGRTRISSACAADSVASYMRNINTHSGYKAFRTARKSQRQSKQQLSGVELARQLSQYSERRDAYVREVRNLIIRNDLEETASAGTAADDIGGS